MPGYDFGCRTVVHFSSERQCLRGISDGDSVLTAAGTVWGVLVCIGFGFQFYATAFKIRIFIADIFLNVRRINALKFGLTVDDPGWAAANFKFPAHFDVG